MELKDWLFALESAQEMADGSYLHDSEVSEREERSWHMTFQNINISAKGTPVHAAAGKTKTTGKQKYPIELITVRTDFLPLFCKSVFASIMFSSLSFFSFMVYLYREILKFLHSLSHCGLFDMFLPVSSHNFLIIICSNISTCFSCLTLLPHNSLAILTNMEFLKLTLKYEN